MHRKWLNKMLLTSSLFILMACSNIVRFNSLDVGKDGNPVSLKGKLTKPEGTGPFPAIVLLHGSGGVEARRDADWVKRLTNWGYVTLQVDSFGPRGVSPSEVIKRASTVPHSVRARDAHGAMRYLAEFPFVDTDKIAVMGWSHGGLATIVSLTHNYGGNPFKAAIAFYPYCSYSLNWMTAPLLVLTGEEDDWCPASRCKEMMPAAKTQYEVILKIYPGAYHDFDWYGINKIVKGHKVRYNPTATADAILQVKDFFFKHLN